jgi:hypothetical protein
MRTLDFLVRLAADDAEAADASSGQGMSKEEIEKKIESATSVEELESLEKELSKMQSGGGGESAPAQPEQAQQQGQAPAQPEQAQQQGQAPAQPEQAPQQGQVPDQSQQQSAPQGQAQSGQQPQQPVAPAPDVSTLDIPDDVKTEFKSLQNEIETLKGQLSKENGGSPEEQIEMLKKQIETTLPSVNMSQIRYFKRALRRIKNDRS